LFVAENKTALTLAYKLMAREHTALPHFRNAMVKCIKNAGTQIVSAPESAAKPSALVHKVQEVKTKYANLIDTCFNQDRTFHKALKKALVYFVNHDSRFAKYLSLHLDELLRKETKVADDADITAAIMSTMSIFRLLQDKDIFEDYYKQHLAHRLLTSTSVSSEAEELVLSKLQAECGHQFTSRLSGMFKDMEMSTQMGQGFKWHLEKENSLIMDVKVTVLTTGYWPLPRVTPCVLPSAATLITEQFLAFYTNLHTGRKLHWQSNLGTAELRCQFGSTRKELLVSTYQMCILNLFNEKQTYTLAEIKEATKIPDTDLIRHILSLAHPRVRVLVKSPNTKTVEDSHTFSWNHEYKSNRHRVKIPLLQSAKSSVDKNANPNAVPTGVLHKRQIQVDATIVRIMKAAKTLAHNKLVADVISSMSQVFAVEPAFIKRRIEHLMKGEFLQRDVENRRTYHYVA
jgi:cullin 3